ncbi:MAG: hypothetical protein WC405_07150 [Syntrophales bacterium]
MKEISRRVQKLESQADKRKTGVTVFSVRHGHEEEDFRPQHEAFIADGGNPRNLFVKIVKFARGQL